MNKAFDQDRENPSTILPLTTAQEAIYVAHLLDNSEISFNIAHYREINGEIDADLLSKAIGLVVEKTPAYRSVVKIIDDFPCLEVKSSVDNTLTLVDLSKELRPDAAAKLWMHQESRKSFNLARYPLFKFILIKIGPVQFYLFSCIHHIIADAAGAYQCERNVFEVYAALIREEQVDVPEGLDQALKLEEIYKTSLAFKVDQAFWKGELSGIDQQISLSCRSSVSDKLFYRARAELSDYELFSFKEFCYKNKFSL